MLSKCMAEALGSLRKYMYNVSNKTKAESVDDFEKEHLKTRQENIVCTFIIVFFTRAN